MKISPIRACLISGSIRNRLVVKAEADQGIVREAFEFREAPHFRRRDASYTNRQRRI